MKLRCLGAVATLSGAASLAIAGPVRVEVDMDSSAPGVQSSVTVAPGTTVVPGVAVYVYDPEGTRGVLSIGYLGALDRGISFGHVPTPGLVGHVMGLSASEGSPVNPANTGYVFPAMDPGLAGPEVQYIELNASAPALMQQSPAEPIFKADIELMGAAKGDVFNFYVMDFVSVWRAGQNGAFTTGTGAVLDTGGDCVPDGTPGLFGIDPDVSIPVPPAAYQVDYIDGPARIIVADLCYADCNGSGTLTIADFACFQAAFAGGLPYADCNGSGTLTIADFGCFQGAFANGCP